MQALQRAVLTFGLPADHALAGLLRRAAAATICTSARVSAACPPGADRRLSPMISLRSLWTAAPAVGASTRYLGQHACAALHLAPSSQARPVGLQILMSAAPATSRPAASHVRQLSSSAVQHDPGAGEAGADQQLPSAAPAEEAAAEKASPPAAQAPGTPAAPWTFTRHLQKRKIYTKRMGNMLTVRPHHTLHLSN